VTGGQPLQALQLIHLGRVPNLGHQLLAVPPQALGASSNGTGPFVLA
jgi:hypothetical protein